LKNYYSPVVFLTGLQDFHDLQDFLIL